MTAMPYQPQPSQPAPMYAPTVVSMQPVAEMRPPVLSPTMPQPAPGGMVGLPTDGVASKDLTIEQWKASTCCVCWGEGTGYQL